MCEAGARTTGSQVAAVERGYLLFEVLAQTTKGLAMNHVASEDRLRGDIVRLG